MFVYVHVHYIVIYIANKFTLKKTANLFCISYSLRSAKKLYIKCFYIADNLILFLLVYSLFV